MNEVAKSKEITTLFLDIGGVLLTNGWGHESRYLAADTFHLDRAQMEDRHQMAFDVYEMDEMTFDEYLNLTVFYEPRDFFTGRFQSVYISTIKSIARKH